MKNLLLIKVFHYTLFRYAESATSTTAEDADTSAPADTSDNNTSTNDYMGYDTLAAKHKKVLFLMAVTSFLSAVAAYTTSVTVTTNACTTPILVFTSAIVQFLEEYVVDSIVCYSRFWNKQQVQVCSTLCTLMHAMMLLSYTDSKKKATDTASSVTTTASTTNNNTTINPSTVYTSLLDCISRTLLLRTVSRTSPNETINPSQARLSNYTFEAEDRLLYAYMDLWMELLYPKDKHIKALLMRHYEPDYHTTFAHSVYDALFSQVVAMLGTLDLQYETIHSATDTTNTADVIVPTNIADQDILLNVITFLEGLLPLCEQHFDNRSSVWFGMLVPRIVTLAEQYPLISALYRLLKCVLSVGSDALEDVKSGEKLMQQSNDGDEANDFMGVVTATNPTISLAGNVDTITALKTFLLSLQQRIHTSSEHYQQELLDAIISLILSSKQILSLSDIIITLKMSLVTGIQVQLSIHLLTDCTLHDKATLVMYLPQLLPLFDSYLTVTNTTTGTDSNKMFLKSQAATNKMKNKSTKSATATGTTESNTNIQISILRLLGRLGGENKKILSSAEDTVQDMLVWSDRPVVTLDVPLDHGKYCCYLLLFKLVSSKGVVRFTVYMFISQTLICFIFCFFLPLDTTQLNVCLDIILPRLVTLCTTSTSTSSSSNAATNSNSKGTTVDAQCISAAAETLHAIILYMVR